ncbi:hypothetical protein D9M71_401390 [compost metagenome]
MLAERHAQGTGAVQRHPCAICQGNDLPLAHGGVVIGQQHRGLLPTRHGGDQQHHRCRHTRLLQPAAAMAQGLADILCHHALGNPQALSDLLLGQALDTVEQQRLAGIVGQLQQGLVKNLQALAGQQRRLGCRRRTGHLTGSVAVVVAGGDALLTAQGVNRQVAGHTEDETARVHHRHRLLVDVHQLQVGFLRHIGRALTVAHAPRQKLQQVVVVLLEACQQARHG